MKVLVLHGANMNLIGTREPEIYGQITLAELDKRLVEYGRQIGVEVVCSQSNHEGALIEALHEARQNMDAVIFNPGGFTHTSVALRDAISAIEIPVVEVHMSNVYAREDFRHQSFISAVCAGKVVGFGWRSYLYALMAVIDK